MATAEESDLDALLTRLRLTRETTRARRDELATAIDQIADGFAGLGASAWPIAPQSAAERDAQASPVRLGGRTESVVDVLQYEFSLGVLSAADQLHGFAILLREEVSLMGAVTVSRGVFEACLWAAAMVDPTITTDDRLKRALTRRLARLSAGLRLDALLGGDPAHLDYEPDPTDRHGSHRDPAHDIEDICTYASERGWKVEPAGKRRRAPTITPLSIDWLAENLERRVGVEAYAWTSGSSMAHGEHAAATASWIELSQEIGSAPAWLIRTLSTGAWAGPRLLLATLSGYTDHDPLTAQFERFDRAFWNLKVRNATPQDLPGRQSP